MPQFLLAQIFIAIYLRLSTAIAIISSTIAIVATSPIGYKKTYGVSMEVE